MALQVQLPRYSGRARTSQESPGNHESLTPCRAAAICVDGAAKSEGSNSTEIFVVWSMGLSTDLVLGHAHGNTDLARL